jgi:hypothetical protein
MLLFLPNNSRKNNLLTNTIFPAINSLYGKIYLKHVKKQDVTIKAHMP